ncbi:hypothetical protein E1264_17855 [Actinomadura sp. KC216]|uniref:hypothetical protein n=1 Tax=Actinomadura sp. KC216 TaxID=2530370 RepID=UPI0010532398|nr:hypothetical protein [Actinomadura sp. KC216]TDB86463.1 hypothetical protein E1264_17855 [Actinomadura sp. KC216]
MTAEIPAPQIPQSLHAAMAEWGRHHHAIAEIDVELGDLDAVMDGLQRQLTDASKRHRDLGRVRTTAMAEAEIARGMVERGCQLAGIEMPEQPPAPMPPAEPAGIMPVQLAPPSPADRVGDPTPHPPGIEAAPSETVTDPAALEAGPLDAPTAGGDQPAVEPGFQPETRRRGGGRRG